ncbi:hypothetical protein [Lentzea jiangxiensis]|uniref:Secreted protein n=1 Tax=Lentzea jiangxiensis TaxID=641025 RepID=A0A1H0FNH4_9PSEU|nr:hypothetical protein [Lentzea jiangxiensis]SDN96185.1 hypothetical protein SAMN05421507_101853 [Lentzea jiangxiensis]
MRWVWVVLLLAGCSAGQVAPPRSGGTDEGWQVTVYYTAVEAFHGGPAVPVRGCPVIDCENGEDLLGTFPQSFAKAVRDEGTGRTADGRYLNWSHDSGYWLDTEPRDSFGRPLRPFVSAAADGVRTGSRVKLISCGRTPEGGEVDAAVCRKLASSAWEITDEFTPGLGGDRHIDLYLGEETGPDFTGSAWCTTFSQAVLEVHQPS